MMRRSIRGQQLGAGLPRNTWLCELQQQNLPPGPLSLTRQGIWAKQAGDRLSTALIPRLQVTCLWKDMLSQITERTQTQTPQKERKVLPKQMPGFHS